ncbi:beta-lactamase/transpeptidase-like protein [Mycena galopus ATCC 62051]|nr:beta-lactamase/transpeptidase-like protein [Mycena galopus ATCC 62051]
MRKLRTMLTVPSILALLIFPATRGQFASQVPLNDLTKNGGKVVNEELSFYIQNVLQFNNFTGLSLAIVLPDGEVEFAAWGNRTEDGDPVDPETVMNLGSCSKAFLSASLGILMQDFADGRNKSALPNGVTRFTWDTKMRDLLPDEWMTEDKWITEKASLKDLLSHVTGLPGHDGSYSPYDSPEDIVVRMRHLRAAYELRQLYEYNNQMYVTVTVRSRASFSYLITHLNHNPFLSFSNFLFPLVAPCLATLLKPLPSLLSVLL